MKIIIIGGSETGLTLANLLGEKDEVTIIEKDEEKAKKIAEEASALVIEDDGCDMSVLTDAGLADADAIVAAADDKTNLMVCEIAKSENVKKIITLVHDPKKEELFTKLGITQLVSAVGTNVTAIKGLLSQIGDERIITQFGKGKIQIFEQTVSEESSIVGKNSMNNGSRIAAIYRKGEIIIPDEKQTVEAGDVLLVIAKTEDVEKVNKLISGK